MKVFNKIIIVVTILIITLFVTSNFMVFNYGKHEGKPYLVEVSRLVREIENNNFKEIDHKLLKYQTKLNAIVNENETKKTEE